MKDGIDWIGSTRWGDRDAGDSDRQRQGRTATGTQRQGRSDRDGVEIPRFYSFQASGIGFARRRPLPAARLTADLLGPRSASDRRCLQARITG